MKRTAKKLLGILLAVVLVAGMLPAGTVAFAAGEMDTESIQFLGTGTYKNVDEITSYDTAWQNANWKYIDGSGNWTTRQIRQSSGGNANSLRLQAGALPDDASTYESWMAFKVKFTNESLTAGKYSLTMNGTAGANSATFWFAKADSTISDDNAEVYMTDANSLNELSTIAASNVIGEDIVITDFDSEYVLVMKVTGNVRFHISDFTFTRTGDLATTETFDVTPSAEMRERLYFNTSFNSYGENNPNWRFLDTVSYLKDEANSTNALANYIFKNLYLRIGYDGVTVTTNVSPWTALVVKPEEALQPGEYQLSFNSSADSVAVGASVSVYIAPYDATISAGDYAKAENLAFSGTVASGSNSDNNRFVIANPTGEYVFLIRLNYTGTKKEIRLVDFTFTRTGDVPAAEIPSATTATYDLTVAGTPLFKTNVGANYLDSYAATGRNWKWFGARSDFSGAIAEKQAYARMRENAYLDIQPTPSADGYTPYSGVWYSLKLDAPKGAGIYDLGMLTEKFGIGGDENDTSTIWLAPFTSGEATSYMTDKNVINSDEKGWVTGTISGKRYISLGENTDDLILLVKVGEDNVNTRMGYKTITLTPVEATSSALVLSKESISLSETASAELVINGENGKPLMHSAVTYSTEDTDVVSISETGVITPKKAGTATISAVSGNINKTATITVAAPTSELLSGNVSVYVKSLVDGVAGNNGITADNGIIVGNINSSVERGKEITLTATGIEGKEFKYWQSASGVVLSEEESYTFNANSNTAIFGVYESEGEAEEGADVTIRFFNGFGSLIQKVVREKGTLFSAFASEVTDTNYRGYEFDSWMNADDSITEETPINKNDVVVAQYTENPARNYEVTGITNPGNYAYDEVVTAESTDANFSYWTRNSEIVSYNPTYTFSVWGDTDVEEVCEGEKAAVPAVILDNDGDVYMTEYSLPTGYTFVEAGIVFSNSGTPTINSCTSKASSKKISGLHGQFTATPASSETVARGYVIYKDLDGNLMISYSK